MTDPNQQTQQPAGGVRIEGAANVPYLDQWLGQWFIEHDHGRSLFAAIKQLNLSVHLQQQAQQGGQAAKQGGRSDDDPASPPSAPSPADAIDYEQSPRSRSAYGYRVIDGVAVLELRGSLMKHEASMTESTSTVMMRRSVRKAMHDPAVKAVILVIDSPGGTVAGAYDLASDIRALAKIKPVHALGMNCVASAAYLMAAQCRSISATASTLVGSLGTFGVVYDYSVAAEKDGIKVHLLKGRINGKDALMKGAGTPGVAISDEQLARMQEGVDDLNQQFYQAVLDGPRKPKAKSVEGWFADAGVWIADKSRTMGLIDRVESLDEMLARVSAEANGRGGAKSDAGKRPEDTVPSSEASPSIAANDQQHTEQETGATAPDQPMSEATKPAADQPKAATPAELKAACPGANSDFLFAQAEKGATVQQAKDAYLEFQNAQIRARDEEITKLKAAKPAEKPAEQQQDAPAAKKPGVKPVEQRAAEQKGKGGGADDGTAESELEARAAQLQQRNRSLSRQDAVAKVLGSDEDLRQRFVQERNEARQDRIADRIRQQSEAAAAR